LDFRQLEVFVNVVKCGNFSTAAKELYLTQPTVSSHIDSLEKELGVKLFERRSRKAVLTEAGKNFYPYAIDVLRLKQKGIESISRFKTTIQGKINIAASSTPGIYLLPFLIKPFMKLYPLVRFDVSISNTCTVIDKIMDYKADLGFVGSVYKDRQLEYIPVFEDEMVVITPPGYRTFKGCVKEVSFEEIAEEKFIVRGRGSATRKVFEDALKKSNRKMDELNIILEIDSVEGVKNFVEEGFGISVLPRICVKKEDNLDVFCLKDINLKRRFYAVVHKNRVLTPAVERLITILKKEK